MVMQTIQIRLTGQQIIAIDRLVRKGKYPNRSEAVRNILNNRLMPKVK